MLAFLALSTQEFLSLEPGPGSKRTMELNLIFEGRGVVVVNGSCIINYRDHHNGASES